MILTSPLVAMVVGSGARTRPQVRGAPLDIKAWCEFAAKRARAATDDARAFVDPEGYRRRIPARKATFEKLVAEETQVQGGAAGLAGIAWQLVRFRGMDDTTRTPDDKAKYTIAFGRAGSLTARIDCNRGRGTWESSGPSQVELGPLTLTRAMWPPGSLHDQIVKHWSYVRSYVLKDGHLFLSLMVDSGIYEYEPIPR